MLSKFYRERSAAASKRQKRIRTSNEVKKKASEGEELRDYLMKTKKGAEAIVIVMETMFSVFEKTSSLNRETAAKSREYTRELQFLEHQMMQIGEVKVNLKKAEERAHSFELLHEYEEAMRTVNAVYTRCGRAMIEILN